MTDTPDDPETDAVAILHDLVTDADDLGPMERAFVSYALHFIQSGEKYWKRRAGIAAGYRDPSNAAYRLLRRPNVAAVIARGLSEPARELGIDRTFILFKAMTAYAALEAQGDLKTAARYLRIMGDHVDVSAFQRKAEGDTPAGGGLQLPFDIESLDEEETTTMIRLLRKGAARPAE